MTRGAPRRSRDAPVDRRSRLAAGSDAARLTWKLRPDQRTETREHGEPRGAGGAAEEAPGEAADPAGGPPAVHAGPDPPGSAFPRALGPR